MRILKILLCAAVAAFALPALADTWPSHPIKIVVPFAAGGPADVYARSLGQRLEKALGQPFVVEDKPGRRLRRRHRHRPPRAPPTATRC